MSAILKNVKLFYRVKKFTNFLLKCSCYSYYTEQIKQDLNEPGSSW